MREVVEANAEWSRATEASAPERIALWGRVMWMKKTGLALPRATRGRATNLSRLRLHMFGQIPLNSPRISSPPCLRASLELDATLAMGIWDRCVVNVG